MIKVVAIMGSPHKGNSLEVTQRLEAELRRQGDVTFEYLHLRELRLQDAQSLVGVMPVFQHHLKEIVARPGLELLDLGRCCQEGRGDSLSRVNLH